MSDPKFFLPNDPRLEARAKRASAPYIPVGVQVLVDPARGGLVLLVSDGRGRTVGVPVLDQTGFDGLIEVLRAAWDKAGRP